MDDLGAMNYSLTLLEQEECESVCARFLIDDFTTVPASQLAQMRREGLLDDENRPRLMREKHIQYLRKGLAGLSGGFVALDASRPWLVYWIIHALDLLEALDEDDDIKQRCISTLSKCKNGGAFGGGPRQLAHLAPTYAATLALCCIGSSEAFAVIDRPALYRFLLSMKDSSNGFRMHDDGEVDVRGTYTAIAVAALTNVLTPQLVEGVAEYAASCQTYEGGFGGEPGVEAHGGYGFCAIATLCILDACHLVDLDALDAWVARRQTTIEGGYQGRANKLVDACYSFWQGGTAQLSAHARRGDPHHVEAPRGVRWRPGVSSGVSETTAPIQEIVDPLKLQRYILLCAQVFPDGGLRDKPGKGRDYYHTCYALSGLSASQHPDCTSPATVSGSPANLLPRTHPAFNCRPEKVSRMLDHFSGLPDL